MELNYDIILEAFNSYIEDCRQRIKNKIFTDEELESSYYIKSKLLLKNMISSDTSVIDALKIHRNNQIDIKVNHTKRVVNDVTRIADKIGVNIDFEKVLRISALFHDIGRFEQAINSNDYIDLTCKLFNGSNHAEYGYQMLYVNRNFDAFKVPKKYQFVISQPVRYHQLPTLKDDLAIKFTKKGDLDISFITGNESLNEHEKIIVAALVQMVKDVDTLDILYQHLTGEYPVFNDSIKYKSQGDSLEEVSKHFGVSKDEIKSFNGLTKDDITNMQFINVPSALIEPKLLTVPEDIQRRFFNNEFIDLKELQRRKDWTFIIGMWWRLNHFLNNINFVSNLELVKENELLEKIYNMYPDKYKPLVKDAFEFAKQELVDKALKKNEGQIYKLK